jgi:MFS family permease
MNVRAWLVHLYPRAWRARYGDEFEALIEECLHSPLDVLDIFLGALDAHLELSHETNWRSMNMTNKLRTTILIVFAGYIGFVIGGLSFYGLVDDSPAVALMKTDTALSAAWAAVEICSVIALLAFVVGGMPLGLVIVRRTLTSSRRDLRLLLMPVFAFLALLLYAGFLASIAGGWLEIPGVVRNVSPDNFPIGNRLLLGGFMLLFVLGAIASTASVWRVLSNTDAEETTLKIPGRTMPIKLYEFAFLPAVVTSLGMLLMLIGTLAFGWLAYSALPGWFASNQGLLLTSTSFSFGATVTIMTLSTVTSFFGLARGYSSRKPRFS